MKSFHKTNRITMRWMLVSVCIITLLALLLQPAATSYAKGRDRGPDSKHDRGPDPGPDPGRDKNPDSGPDPGRDIGPDPGIDGPRD